MVYLNNAATSWPKPVLVAQKIKESIEQLPLSAERASFGTEDVRFDCRVLLAEMLKIKNCRQIVLTGSATMSANIILQGFPFKEKAVVLVDAASHNAVLRPLYYLKKIKKIDFEIIPVDKSGRVIEKILLQKIEECKPQMVVLTHASNVTGAVNQIDKIFENIKEKNQEICTVLDASQTLGSLPLFLEGGLADICFFTGHKYLFGPQGTGGFYCSEKIELEAVFTGGTGVRSDLEVMPPQMPMKLEAGTQAEALFAGLKQALLWHKKKSLEAFKDLQEKRFYLKEKLKKINELQIIDDAHLFTPVISFKMNKISVEDIGEILTKSFDVVCRTGLHCAPLVHRCIDTLPQGTVRLSLSYFNKTEEFDWVYDALQKIAKM